MQDKATEQESSVKSILDPSFQYTPAVATDLRATFASIREQQRIERERQHAQESVQTRRVIAIFDARRREAEQAAMRG